MTSFLHRLLRGDPRRKTRLHDFEGNLLPLSGLVYAGPCIATTVARKLGSTTLIPWIPYPVLLRLRRVLGPGARVLEFGSGGSTLWLARRVSTLVSIEHEAGWFERVNRALRENPTSCHIDYRLCQEPEAYCEVAGYPAAHFDLTIVDGHWRHRAARKALEATSAGGYIYFDNSDVPDPDYRDAVRMLEAAASHSERLLGFAPGQLAVNQGVLVRTRATQALDR
jgi:predicted O-methyltransferase YrrM